MVHLRKNWSTNQVAVFLIIAISLILGINNIFPTQATVTSVTSSDNLLLNSQFKALDYGSDPIASSTGVGKFFNSRWRSKYGHSTSTASLQQVSKFSGGTKMTLSNTEPDFFYIRQTVPGVMQFSNKTFTLRADVGNTDSGLKYDFYVNARWNNSDWLNIIDTDVQNLSRGVFTTTFTVSDLSAYSSYVEDFNGGLEIAFRVYSPDPKTNAEVIVDSISLFEGSNLSESPISDYNKERPVLYTYYETAGYSTGVVGLDTATGQKRATFPMTSPKRRGTSYEVTFYDALGNEGKVSTYSKSGARTDNVAPDSVRNSTNSIIFVFYESNIAGIGLSWTANSET